VSNILDIPLPRERIKVPLSFALNLLVLLVALPFVISGYAGLVFFLLDWIFSLRELWGGREQSIANRYIIPLLGIPIAIYGTILLGMVIRRNRANPVKIIAVQIDRVTPRWGKVWYDFRGGRIEQLAFHPPRSDEGLFFVLMKRVRHILTEDNIIAPASKKRIGCYIWMRRGVLSWR